MKTWLRGGLIGGIIALVISLLGFALEEISPILDTIFLAVNLPGIIALVFFFGPYNAPEPTLIIKTIFLIIVVAFWFLIGAAIGLIIHKIKSKK